MRNALAVALAALVLLSCGGTSSPRSTAANPVGTARPATSGSAPSPTHTAQLEILQPANGSVVVTPIVAVSGNAPPGSEIVRDVSLGRDDSTTADPSGAWSMDVELQEGSNELVFRVGDDPASEQRVTVVYDPSAAVATPSAGRSLEPGRKLGSRSAIVDFFEQRGFVGEMNDLLSGQERWLGNGENSSIAEVIGPEDAITKVSLTFAVSINDTNPIKDLFAEFLDEFAPGSRPWAADQLVAVMSGKTKTNKFEDRKVTMSGIPASDGAVVVTTISFVR